jgi:hypothetical protein
VGFESWLERDHVMAMDFDPDITGIASQPFWLHWRDEDGRGRRHAPDFFARRADGSGQLSAGKHTTGSAATRRGLAGRPQRMFSQAHPAAPGELMEIDSTPPDVLVLLDDGVPGRWS